MGCDIHMKVEVRFSKGWGHLEGWQTVLDLGLCEQNYDIFGLLAEGVRTDYPDDGPYENIHIHEVNGIPDNISWSVWRDLHQKVMNNDSPCTGADCILYDKAVELLKRCPWVKIYKEDALFSEAPQEISELPEEKTLDNTSHIYIDNPDLHSHCHISIEEFKEIIDDYVKLCSDKETKSHMACPDDEAIYWKAVYSFCDVYKQRGYKVRLVYWFDS